MILLNELIGYYRQTSEKENLLGIIDDSIDLLKNSDDIEGREIVVPKVVG